MRIIVFLFLGMVLLTMQTSLLPILPEWLGQPDFIFLFIVFVSIYLKTHQAVIICLVFGTAVEVFSGYFLGLYVITYLLLFVILKGASVPFHIREATYQPPIVVFAYLLVCGLVYLFTSMLTEERLAVWRWGTVLQRVLIVTILVIPFTRCCLFLMSLCDKKHESRSFIKDRINTRNGNYYKRDLE